MIQTLLSRWPRGAVAVQAWLERQGVSRQLAAKYCRYGWVRKVGHGAYAQANDQVDWTGGLYALQTQLGLPVHAAAKTALQLQGYAHFVQARDAGPVHLFGRPGVRLPSWFAGMPWGARVRYTAPRLFDDGAPAALTERERAGYSVRLSAPERAILELLHLVPAGEAYEEARLIMEGLGGLRPQLVQKLLEACRSIKVKRLFLCLAEGSGHPWFRKLDVSRVGLGHGNRMVFKGGTLHPRFRITIPPRGGRSS